MEKNKAIERKAEEKFREGYDFDYSEKMRLHQKIYSEGANDILPSIDWDEEAFKEFVDSHPEMALTQDEIKLIKEWFNKNVQILWKR